MEIQAETLTVFQAPQEQFFLLERGITCDGIFHFSNLSRAQTTYSTKRQGNHKKHDMAFINLNQKLSKSPERAKEPSFTLILSTISSLKYFQTSFPRMLVPAVWMQVFTLCNTQFPLRTPNHFSTMTQDVLFVCYSSIVI